MRNIISGPAARRVYLLHLVIVFRRKNGFLVPVFRQLSLTRRDLLLICKLTYQEVARLRRT
jgi:hypothetical protein